jgi:hypothetical protein
MASFRQALQAQRLQVVLQEADGALADAWAMQQVALA